MLYSLLMLFLGTALGKQQDASTQILQYAKKNQGCPGILSTSAGAPVEFEDANNTQCEPLIYNPFFMDSMTHFVRERIPLRVVHTKGAGAFGYFEVTHNVTDICKADLFSYIGKKTPVAVRFSPVSSDSGVAETVRNPRGYAVKFYTEDGNFDIVGLNFPVFQLKDPILFPGFIRAQARNPVTHLQDANTFWDFVTLRPLALYLFLFVFGDRGIPDGYRHMPGYSIHTYQVSNQRGDKYYVRFHFIPDLGIKNLRFDEAMKIAGVDPDYATRDLYNAIERGEFPSWKVSIQVLTLKQVKTASFDVFDVTKTLPLNKYPLRPLGRIYLNKNPLNYFADIEQLAYCPGNLVPGIEGAPDKLFESRVFAYRDAENYRLGVNHNKINVNYPKRSKVMTYNRDGRAPVKYNGDGAPNYYPNSFFGPETVDNYKSRLIRVCGDDTDNYEQASDFYMNQLTKDERSRLVENIVDSLKDATKRIQNQAVYWFTVINRDLGSRISAALKKVNQQTNYKNDNLYPKRKISENMNSDKFKNKLKGKKN